MTTLNDQFTPGKSPPNALYKELRPEALAWLASGKTIAEVADDLGLTRSTVGQWAHIERLRIEAAAKPKPKLERTPAPYRVGYRWYSGY